MIFLFWQQSTKVSEIQNLLKQFSSKGDLESIKQIFAYVNQQNINVGNVRDMISESQGKSFTSISAQEHLSPLIEAAKKGHAQVCEYFISQQSADIDAKNNYFSGYNYYTYDSIDYITTWTALMVAVDCNQTEVIKVLLRHNPDIRAQDHCGYHATYIAACKGYVDALKMLVRKDRHVIDFRGPDGMTPLIAASIGRVDGRVDICKYLVQQKNANVDLKDKFGGTALTYATNPVIIDILKKNRKYQYLKSDTNGGLFVQKSVRKHGNGNTEIRLSPV